MNRRVTSRILGAAAVLLIGAFLAGCGAKPAATVPPAGDQTAKTAAPSFDKVLVSYDVVRGSKNVAKADAATKICVENSRYLHNEEIVWRIKVTDPKTGALMDDKALSGVSVKLGDGTELKAKYGGHPGKNATDAFWAVSFDIPESYPTGTLKFDINATAADGRGSQLVSFNVAPALLTVIDGKVPVAVAAK